MDDKIEKALWDELKLIQPIINKFDDITFKIKNWFITLFIAVGSISIYLKYPQSSSIPSVGQSSTRPSLLILNIFLIIIFYFYEVTYRSAHGAFLERCKEVQALLRNEREYKDTDKAPNIDRYLFPKDVIFTSKFLKRLLSIYIKLGIEEGRAKKNIYGTKSIVEEAFTMMTQLRISFIYASAFLINIILASIFKDYLAVIISIVALVILIAYLIVRYLTKSK